MIKSRKLKAWPEKSLVAVTPNPDLVLFVSHSPETKVFLSRLDRHSMNEYMTTKQLDIRLQDDEQITCLKLLPIMSCQKTSVGSVDWTVLIFGFSSGHVKFYTDQAICLLDIKFCDEYVIGLKCQTMRQNCDALSEIHYPVTTDEFMIIYKSTIYVLDGVCLHENLKISRSNTLREKPDFEPAYTLESLPATLNCKRWNPDPYYFPQLKDAEILGTRNTPQFNNLFSLSMNDEHVSNKTYGSSIALAGKNPFLCCYKETITSNQISYGEVLGSLLSIWSKPPPQRAQITEPKSAISIFFDKDRLATSITGSPDKRLLAITDDFGRVSLVDIANWIIIRMWKGYRGAQCGWLEVKRDKEERKSPRALFLVIYLPKRGFLEVWSAQRGPRVASFNVGKNCTLVYVGHKMLNMREELKQKNLQHIAQVYQPYENHCYLLDPKNECILQLEIPYSYSLYKFSDSKYKDILNLKELQVALDNMSDVMLVSEIVQRLMVPESIETAIQNVAYSLQPENVVVILENLILKTMSSYDTNPGVALSTNDESIVELCKRTIKLCELFQNFNDQSANQNLIPVVNKKLIEEYEEHPDELDKFASILSWPASDILRFLSLISLDSSLRIEHDSNPWPSLGEPLVWSDFVGCFDLSRYLQPKHKEKNHITKHKESLIGFHRELKSLNEDKIVKTAMFIYGKLSQTYCQHSSLQANLKALKIDEKDECDILEPPVNLALLFQFWLSSSLSKYWRMWPFLQARTKVTTQKLSNFAKQGDKTIFIKCWRKIYQLIISTDNLFAAVIASNVIKVNSTKELLREAINTTDSQATRQDVDVDTNNTVSSSSGSLDTSEWECLCVDSERMSLLTHKLESLYVLSMLLQYIPKHSSKTPIVGPLVYKIKKLSIENLFHRGPTIVSELVAQWALQTKVHLCVLTQNYGEDESETNLKNKTKPIVPGRKIVAYSIPKQVYRTSQDAKDEDEQIKELVHHARNLFPFSLDADILLMNYFWECGQAWVRNPLEATNNNLLTRCFNSLTAIVNTALRYRLACLGCKTFFQKPLEILGELLNRDPLFGKKQTTLKNAKARDNLLKKELHMDFQTLKTFVIFAFDLTELIIRLESLLQEELEADASVPSTFDFDALADKLLTFDDWWTTPVILNSSSFGAAPSSTPELRSTDTGALKSTSSTYCKPDNELSSSLSEAEAEAEAEADSSSRIYILNFPELPDISNSLNKMLLTSASVMDLQTLCDLNNITRELRPTFVLHTEP